MGTDPVQFFEDAFFILKKARPYPWQKKLFLDMVGDGWPQVLPLPTGSGKTSVLYVWLLALAWSLRTGISGIPRRLVWVVNRRVVVDQVTKEAEDLNKALNCLPEIHDVLAAASVSGAALAISTLRGQHADDGAWALDPSTPAIVIGTVDMIGSRLLFRGYGAGPYFRPAHAGLLGVDTLIVNDEAHLSHAFAALLEKIHKLRPSASIPGKCFRVLLLSATPGESGLKAFQHSLDEDILQSEDFRRVFTAPKTLTLHDAENKTAVEAKLWQLAITNPAPRTVVFIESPEKAAAFVTRLATQFAKEGHQIAALMTGTMRGRERDDLIVDPTFKKFLAPEPPSEPCWLVATSAAEVGVNLTCERMGTSLVEADHLVQRFGRLNRFGGGEGEAHVVCVTLKESQKTLHKTLQYLKDLQGDISCRNVWEHPAPPEASSDQPALAHFDKHLIETWAQTSYKDKDVPRVAAWLHGKEEDSGPEAELAWRADVPYLIEWRIDSEQIEEILKRYPVRPHERLREPASRVLSKLEIIAEKLGDEAGRLRLIQVDSDGTPAIITLPALLKAQDIAYKLLLLPDKGAGRLERGMFVAELPPEADSLDVADGSGTEQNATRRRLLFEEQSWSRLGNPDRASEFPGDITRDALSDYARDRDLRAPLVIRGPQETEEKRLLVYYAEPVKQKRGLKDVFLEEHQAAVADRACELAKRVGLEHLAQVYSTVGLMHDMGKRREVWQRAFGGCMEKPIAKSKGPVNTRLLGGYRHELGSLVEAAAEKDELLLHLIASHHAAARPHFSERQFDRKNWEKSSEAALASVHRYARLQAEFGPWGLAYLEAIFKSADALVSSSEGGAVSE